MKKVLKILLSIIVVIVLLGSLIVAGIFWMTSGVTQEADKVLTQLHNNKIEEVYKNSAFADEMSIEKFKEALGVGTPIDFTKMKKISWTGRGFKNGIKYVDGDFTFSDGETVSIRFAFIVTDGKYILVGIRPVENSSI